MLLRSCGALRYTQSCTGPRHDKRIAGIELDTGLRMSSMIWRVISQRRGVTFCTKWSNYPVMHPGQILDSNPDLNVSGHPAAAPPPLGDILETFKARRLISLRKLLEVHSYKECIPAVQ